MEKHHKLRRPQGSSIHGCNICGVEGHQAAFCMNGSVDWANKWPRECFVIEPPQTTLRKEPDFRKMARDAKAYAKKRMRMLDRERRRAAGEEVSESEEEQPKTEASETGGKPAIAAGWVMYHDKLGRPYYHNKLSGKTQWTLPTA
ncbi:WW domain [Ostreococcus tauri]|uniref:WW domain n=1 Tax=Ostreococcus tauri TaxID=70448 RepID=Q00TJ8_OSTTA|nr:WW domain [Ostreococcus tauri]OUS45352.1 hypothetical protein BE221DRAFT_76756 [Ostreococcus tauri]CAL57818.1 WW domain [Ostreococcus tauri]|eukprot:XP_003083851.1 WW domain [Ostreococcus tauri]